MPGRSISDELLYEVVLPSAMLTLAMTSATLAILKNGIGRTALYLAAMSLTTGLILLVTGLLI